MAYRGCDSGGRDDGLNVEELRELAEALVADVASAGVVARLGELQQAVAQQVANPMEPAVQNTVAQARSSLGEALRAGAVDEFNARWRDLVDEMNLGVLLPDILLDRLDDLFLQNQVTPQVVNDSIAVISGEVTNAVTTLEQLIGALRALGLDSSALGPGQFEAAVVVPRGEVGNALGALGREFQELETLIRPFIEAEGESPPPLEVRQIASSDFLAVVCMTPAAALLLSKAIDGVLAVYERVLKIRKLRQELSEAGLQAVTVEAIEHDATDMVEREIPAIVKAVMDTAQGLPDDGRRHEIEMAVTRSVRGIAKRTDHGFRMTVRAGPPPERDDGEEGHGGDGDGGGAAELARIRELVVENQRRSEFHELAGEPILRELDEGEMSDAPSVVSGQDEEPSSE